MRCSVLIADDEQAFVELIADVLEEEGFTVMRAYDGLQASRAILRRLPNLVIADVMMPRMGGLALARVLHEREDPIPVILMSAARQELSGYDGPFLPKPFDLEELVTMARDLTGGPIVANVPSRSQSTRATQTRQISAGN
jgi:DNA-binding response OmpR family regulator